MANAALQVDGPPPAGTLDASAVNAEAPSSSTVQLPASVALCLLLACSLAISSNAADADLWGHVRFGQDFLHHGAVARTATHTFTATEQPWINHENLSEIVFAIVADLGGARALLFLKFVLGIAVLTAIGHAALRQRANPIVIATVLVLVAVNLTAGWTVRPQMFSYALFTLLIVLLDQSFGPGRPPKLSLLLWSWPLFAVWANTHGGFLAGLGVFGLYMVGRAVQALMRDGIRAAGTVAALAGITIGAVGATLLTPYGVELWRWLVASLGPPRPEIPEWVALTWHDAKFWPFVALAGLTVVAMALTQRPRYLVQTVVLTVIAWQAVAHQRHIAFFAIAAGFWLPAHLQSLVARWQDTTLLHPEGTRPAVAPNAAPSRTMIVVLGAVCVALAVPLGLRLRDMPVERGEYPVSALQFMSDERLNGRLVVTFNWAQYALAALAPATTVAFDGRYDTCYPAEVVDMHFDFVLGDDPARRWRNPASPPFDASRVLDYAIPDLVLISRTQRPAVDTISSQPDWVLLYQDGLAQLWGRRFKYDDPARADYFAPARRHVSDAPQTGHVSWPGFPQPRARGADDKVRAIVEWQPPNVN